MKRIHCLLSIISLTLCLFSCSKLNIEFSDPQDVKTIHDEFLFEDLNKELLANDDLVELFGEENINFGPVPPTWDSTICFLVDGMDFIACDRYIFDPYHDNEIIHSHADPPVYDGSKNLHLFYDQTQCIYKHKMTTIDPYQNHYLMNMEKTYIIGHDALFTTYFQGKTEGNGNPTVIILISGTMVFDTIRPDSLVFKGIEDYIFGKKILDYEYQPTNAYAPGTIEIKKHPGLSPACKWDDL